MGIKIKILCFLFSITSLCSYLYAQNIKEVSLLLGASKTKEEASADDEFIKETISLYGSKEKAFNTFVDSGWKEIIENKTDESIQDFKKAWLLNPENPDSYLGLSLVMQLRKIKTDADDLFKKGIAIDKDKKSQKKFFQRALDFANRKRDTMLLISFLSQSLSVDSSSIQTFQKLAYFCSLKKMYNDALNAYTGAIRFSANDSSLYFNRGLIFKKIKKNKEAITDFTKAVDLSKQPFYDAILNRGLLQYEEGDYNTAIADYNLCIELNPKDPLPFRFLGILLIIIYDHKGACKAWKKAIKLGDTSAKELYNTQCN